MSQVEQIMARNHRVIELDNISYRVHRLTAQVAIEAFGPGALMLVAQADGSERVELNRETVGSGAELMKRVLGVAMISPRLGDVDDPSSDTVTWLTLGDHGPRLYSELMEGDSERAANFPDSSVDQPDQ